VRDWEASFPPLEAFGDDSEQAEQGRRMVRQIQATNQEILRIVRAEMTRRGMLLPELPEGMDLGGQPQAGA